MKDIVNAKNYKTDDLASGLPNVGEAIQELLQPVVVTIIQKQQIAGYTQEIPINIETKASIQPLTAQQLKITAEGQRAWKYYTIFVLRNVNVEPDEGFCIKRKGYRVLSKTDWKEFGYIEYATIEDYQFVPEQKDA